MYDKTNPNDRKSTRASNRHGSGNKKGRNRNSGNTKCDNPSSATRDGMMPTHNHDEWYSAFPSLVQSSANLPYTNPLGEVLPTFGAAGSLEPGIGNGCLGVAAPAIIVASVMPAPGISTSNFSAINVAAGAFMTSVRYKQSGDGKYDRSDLMLYPLAVDSCYTLWAECVRAYALLMTYSYNNRYYARSIVRALGFDYDDFTNQLPRFRGMIDEFGAKIAQLVIPANLGYVSRHLWLFGNVFVDSASVKAQAYAYKPSHYWKYNELTDVKGAYLSPEHRPAYWTMSALASYMDELFSAMYQSSTMMNMSGDIRRAYEGNVQTLAAIPEYITPPIQYDERMVMEFQNLTCVGELADEEAEVNRIRVSNDLNAILFNPEFETGEVSAIAQVNPDTVMLNVRMDNPTPADTMKATRSCVIPIVEDDVVRVHSCGSEIPLTLKVYYNVKDMAGNVGTRSFNVYTWIDFGVYPAHQVIAQLSMVEKFDLHPRTYVYNTEEDKVMLMGVTGDVDNYTTLNRDTLNKIHQAAIMSLFYSTGMGNFYHS